MAHGILWETSPFRTPLKWSRVSSLPKRPAPSDLFHGRRFQDFPLLDLFELFDFQGFMERKETVPVLFSTLVEQFLERF